MTRILDIELAERALDLIAPAVLQLFVSGLANRHVLVVVVLDPTDGSELTSYTFGDLPRGEWSREYDKLALDKAKLAYDHKMDSAMVVQMYPHLMQQGDVKFRGGVFHFGIAVGASGTQGYFDEMVSRWIAGAIVAMAHHKIAPALENRASAHI